MIGETLSLLASMYHDIGPGFLLALSLPVFVVAFLFVLLALRNQANRS